jgi:His-Xaa-Ser system radical SAM maturase HxsC
MLPLHGVASHLKGFNKNGQSEVIRLRSISNVPSRDEDVALLENVSDLKAAAAAGFSGAAVIGDLANELSVDLKDLRNVIVLPGRFSYLSDGDILGVQSASRRFRTLYRQSSSHNSFLVTERCNHYCLMCSQPPRDVDDEWILDEIERALPLVDPSTKSFAFTGGEPLLNWRDFIRLLEQCRDVLPTTAIHVLSNGRAFADTEIVSAWANVRHLHLTTGIPIYSAVDHVHDYVVQAAGAFDETVLGILKLKDQRQRIEIRVVLHAITAPRIVETCRWLARNLPFVDHVALMGLENTGFVLANSDLLWIDPIDYQEPLTEAVELLAAAKIKVSIYNLQRCLLDRSVWSYAAQSISDWKNGYYEECERCIEKPRCSGFFTSGRPRRSRGIHPISA